MLPGLDFFSAGASPQTTEPRLQWQKTLQQCCSRPGQCSQTVSTNSICSLSWVHRLLPQGAEQRKEERRKEGKKEDERGQVRGKRRKGKGREGEEEGRGRKRRRERRVRIIRPETQQNRGHFSTRAAMDDIYLIMDYIYRVTEVNTPVPPHTHTYFFWKRKHVFKHSSLLIHCKC